MPEPQIAFRHGFTPRFLLGGSKAKTLGAECLKRAKTSAKPRLVNPGLYRGDAWLLRSGKKGARSLNRLANSDIGRAEGAEGQAHRPRPARPGRSLVRNGQARLFDRAALKLQIQQAGQRPIKGSAEAAGPAVMEAPAPAQQGATVDPALAALRTRRVDLEARLQGLVALLDKVDHEPAPGQMRTPREREAAEAQRSAQRADIRLGVATLLAQVAALDGELAAAQAGMAALPEERAAVKALRRELVGLAVAVDMPGLSAMAQAPLRGAGLQKALLALRGNGKKTAEPRVHNEHLDQMAAALAHFNEGHETFTFPTTGRGRDEAQLRGKTFTLEAFRDHLAEFHASLAHARNPQAAETARAEIDRLIRHIEIRQAVSRGVEALLDLAETPGGFPVGGALLAMMQALPGLAGAAEDVSDATIHAAETFATTTAMIVAGDHFPQLQGHDAAFDAASRHLKQERGARMALAERRRQLPAGAAALDIDGLMVLARKPPDTLTQDEALQLLHFAKAARPGSIPTVPRALRLLQPLLDAEQAGREAAALRHDVTAMHIQLARIVTMDHRRRYKPWTWNKTPALPPSFEGADARQVFEALVKQGGRGKAAECGILLAALHHLEMKAKVAEQRCFGWHAGQVADDNPPDPEAPFAHIGISNDDLRKAGLIGAGDGNALTAAKRESINKALEQLYRQGVRSLDDVAALHNQINAVARKVIGSALTQGQIDMLNVERARAMGQHALSLMLQAVDGQQKAAAPLIEETTTVSADESESVISESIVEDSIEAGPEQPEAVALPAPAGEAPVAPEDPASARIEIDAPGVTAFFKERMGQLNATLLADRKADPQQAIPLVPLAGPEAQAADELALQGITDELAETARIARNLETDLVRNYREYAAVETAMAEKRKALKAAAKALGLRINPDAPDMLAMAKRILAVEQAKHGDDRAQAEPKGGARAALNEYDERLLGPGWGKTLKARFGLDSAHLSEIPLNQPLRSAGGKPPKAGGPDPALSLKEIADLVIFLKEDGPNRLQALQEKVEAHGAALDACLDFRAGLAPGAIRMVVDMVRVAMLAEWTKAARDHAFAGGSVQEAFNPLAGETRRTIEARLKEWGLPVAQFGPEIDDVLASRMTAEDLAAWLAESSLLTRADGQPSAKTGRAGLKAAARAIGLEAVLDRRLMDATTKGTVFALIETLQKGDKFDLKSGFRVTVDSGKIPLEPTGIAGIKAKLAMAGISQFEIERGFDVYRLTVRTGGEVKSTLTGVAGTRIGTSHALASIEASLALEGAHQRLSGFTLSFTNDEAGCQALVGLIGKIVDGKPVSMEDWSEAVDLGRSVEAKSKVSLTAGVAAAARVGGRGPAMNGTADLLGIGVGASVSAGVAGAMKETEISSHGFTLRKGEVEVSLVANAGANIFAHVYNPTNLGTAFAATASGGQAGAAERFGMNAGADGVARTGDDYQNLNLADAANSNDLAGLEATVTMAVAKKWKQITNHDGHFTECMRSFASTLTFGGKEAMVLCNRPEIIALLEDPQHAEFAAHFRAFLKMGKPDDAFVLGYMLRPARMLEANLWISRANAARREGDAKQVAACEAHARAIVERPGNYYPNAVALVGTAAHKDEVTQLASRFVKVDLFSEGKSERMATRLEFPAPADPSDLPAQRVAS